MSSLPSPIEKLVRPFSGNGYLDVFNSHRAPPVAPVENGPEYAVLEWEGKHDGQFITTMDPMIVQNFEAKWEEDKSQRETDQVRVENPDDPDQYVEVERITQMVFRENPTGRELRLKPDWSS